MNSIRKIVSGGQTGADRAAFDFALSRGIEIGGFVPKGRLAEDGRILDKYPNLAETETDDPAERTEHNVTHADATLIFSHGQPIGGSGYAAECARLYEKPLMHVDFTDTPIKTAAAVAAEWIAFNSIEILNIAGPRASEDPAIYDSTSAFLKILFDTERNIR